MNRIQRDAYSVSRGVHISDAAFEYFQSILLTGTYLAKLTAAMGISDSLTGVLASVTTLGGAFRIASVYLFREPPYKRRVMAFEAVNQLLIILLYLLPLLSLPAGVGIAVFSVVLISHFMMLNGSFPPKISWMTGLIDDNKRGRFTAVKEMISLISGAGFTYAMGAVIDRYEALGCPEESFRVCIAVLAALFAVRMVLLAVCKEKPAPRSGSASGMRALLRLPIMRRLIGLNILICLPQCVTNPFLGTYQVGELGFSMTFVAVLSMIYSAVRIAASFYLGSYADRKGFASMMQLCFCLMGLAFAVNVFTTPANGRIMFTMYYSLFAMCMGGLNSASTNLIFDYVEPDQCSSVLALYSSVGGLAGFLITLAVSPLVAYIQAQGNQLFGMHVYAQQLTSALSVLFTLVLIFYTRRFILPMKRPNASAVA